jgi:DNA-binding transcriptional ArsR family regulator
VITCLLCKPYNEDKIFNILNIFTYNDIDRINGNQMTTSYPATKIFKALMHPSRLEILEILRDGEQCVCHIEAQLGYRQAYISQHLMVLREAKLVEDRRDGARIFYRVTKHEVFDLVDTASDLCGIKQIRLSQKRAANCPCPKCSTSSGADEENILIAEGSQKANG